MNWHFPLAENEKSLYLLFSFLISKRRRRNLLCTSGFVISFKVSCVCGRFSDNGRWDARSIFRVLLFCGLASSSSSLLFGVPHTVPCFCVSRRLRVSFSRSIRDRDEWGPEEEKTILSRLVLLPASCWGEKKNQQGFPLLFYSEEIKISGENVVIKMALSTFYYFVLPDSEVL